MSITSADITFLLAIPGLFTTPQQLQGFSMEGLFDVDVTDAAEVETGADGTGTAGWLPQPVPQTIRFLADSPSVAMFELWNVTQAINGDGQGGPGVFYASGTIQYPSIGKKYTLYRGVLRRNQAAPSAGRVLKAREFGLTWLTAPGQLAVFPQPL